MKNRERKRGRTYVIRNAEQLQLLDVPGRDPPAVLGDCAAHNVQPALEFEFDEELLVLEDRQRGDSRLVFRAVGQRGPRFLGRRRN
jgi:hypothetical protein